MRIGELAQATGCQVVTIRYYERVGILPRPARAANNYRAYSEAHLRRLRFVQRTRGLGFRLEEVRTLIRLIDQGDYTCEDVRMLAQGHLDDIRQRLADLQQMEATLADLVGRCSGDVTPDCSLLESLFDETGGSTRAAQSTRRDGSR